MRFVHLSDSHLGYRQYGLVDRENDFYEVFERTIDKIIELKPDFIIHSGDLFDAPRPPTIALLKVQEAVNRLKDENIDFYALPGNHDRVLRKNSIPPQTLYRDIGLKLISPKNPYFILDDTFIGGIPYTSKANKELLKENLKVLEDRAGEYTNRILVLHQGIDKFLPYEYELEIGDIPEIFHYYALGHLHNRIEVPFGLGKMVYPGSMDIWRMDELSSYKKFSKGFHLVNLEEGVVESEMIDIPISREFIREKIDYKNLKEDLANLSKQIESLDDKPIVNLNIQGEKFDRTEAYEIINKSLSDDSLILRPSFTILDDKEVEAIDFEGQFRPKEIVKEILRTRFKDKDESDFAIHLMDEILNKNEESCSNFIEKFYNNHYEVSNEDKILETKPKEDDTSQSSLDSILGVKK